MTAQPSLPDRDQPWVIMMEEVEDYAFANLFRIQRARLQFRRFDGRMSEPITRICFERGDSAGVLLHDPAEHKVILVSQFRYPVYTTLEAEARSGDGAQQAWILELVAGVVEQDYTVGQVADKELLEEAGYRVIGDLEPITTIWPSPGGTSERIHLFLGEVDGSMRTGKGGGVASEGEDIRTVALSLKKAMEMVARGEIQDAKTIIALQYLALRRLGARGPDGA
jgi:ADP-ribose pyrophosphatase